MRIFTIITLTFLTTSLFAQSRAPAVMPTLTLEPEQKQIAPDEAKGFDFRKEENKEINVQALLGEVARDSGHVPTFITIILLMLAPAAISLSILSTIKKTEEPEDLRILFEEESFEAPVSLDEYRKSKTSSKEEFKKAG